MKLKSILLLCIVIIAVVCAVIFITQAKKNNQEAKFQSDSKITKTMNELVPQGSHEDMNQPAGSEVLSVELFESELDMIQFALEKQLGRAAGFSERYRRENDQWLIICGRPVEEDGASFDYTNSLFASLYRENLMEDNACLLGEKIDSKVRLWEANIGSLDSPILSWVENHKLSIELIK